MKKTFVSVAVLVAMSMAMVSCGSSNNSAAKTHQLSGFKYRAFVSNPLFPNGVSNTPVINIVNAANDVLSTSPINLLGEVAQPGMMFESPSLKYTLVYSPSGNAITVVDNTTESIAAVSGTTNSVPVISLPGSTESLVFAPNGVTAYAAVPNAPVTGQAPGAVVVMNVTSGAITATIPVPGAHFVAISPDGNSLLVFSDGSNSVSVIATILIGSTQTGLVTVVPGFDHPVGAIFSGSTAYVFNCGPECGGATAGINTFSVGAPPSAILPVPGATYGVLNGNTLWVAGAPPATPCPSGTAATRCGVLSAIDIASMTMTVGPVLITDGYHNRMQISDNGQLFVGARSCTNVNTSSEVRGCLSIYDTSTSAVVIPPVLGDATGIQPIQGRNVVYVCQGGTFEIFDTTTDKLLIQQTGTVIVGQSFDVKLVDPPTS